MNRPAAGGRRSGPDGGVQWFRALLLVVVLIVVGVLILDHTGKSPSSTSSPSTTRPRTTSTTAPAPTTTVALVPPAQIKVQVLNGLRTGSLAGQWSTKLRTLGYQTQPPDDATATVSASIIYVVTPGYDAEARQLATSIGLAPTAVSSTLPANAPVPAKERTTSNLILVVGPNLAGTA